MADWEDEEDAFLYGGSTSTAAGPAASTSAAGLTAQSAGSQQQTPDANPVLSMYEQSTVEAVDEGEGEADMDEGHDEEEDEEEEEESDDDFQIIMDANPAAGPAAHHDLARKTGAVPVKPPVPSLVRDLPRQDSIQPSTSSGRLQDRASPTKPAPASGPSNPFVSLQTSVHATGSPVPAPSRSPPPNLNDTSATYTATRKDESESKPEPQPIVDVDLDSIEDKKWRKPGAYLSDYFNYGFDEATWKEWCGKQNSMRKDRDREREHPFHVFADLPLPEAWASLPMELKGLMMQTIMSSFNGASGSQQQQQMMQGMMPGMGGMQGMPPNMQGNPMNMGSMGGMPMGGMPMGGGMNMMGGGPGQQSRGMNGGFGGPGMQQQNRGR